MLRLFTVFVLLLAVFTVVAVLSTFLAVFASLPAIFAVLSILSTILTVATLAGRRAPGERERQCRRPYQCEQSPSVECLGLGQSHRVAVRRRDT